MNCKSCQNAFSEENLAYIVDNCCHNFCYQCISKNSSPGIVRCPLCKRDISMDQTELQPNLEFLKNLQVFQNIMKKAKKFVVICNLHNRKIVYFQQKFRRFGCLSCLFDDYQNNFQDSTKCESFQILQDLQTLQTYFQNSIESQKELVEKINQLISQNKISIDFIYALNLLLINNYSNEKINNLLFLDNQFEQKIQQQIQEEIYNNLEKNLADSQMQNQKEIDHLNNQLTNLQMEKEKLEKEKQIQDKKYELDYQILQEKFDMQLMFGKSSTLLSYKFYEQIKIMMNVLDLNLNFIYKGSQDGFKAQNFHSFCDNKGPTLCLILSEKLQTFGGYVHPSWQSNNEQIQGEGKSFIFQLDQNTKHPCINNENEIFGGENNLIVFGRFGQSDKPQSDIFICNQSNEVSNSYCNLGDCYQLPHGYSFGAEVSKNYLAGCQNFKVLEIEVYQVLN